MERCARPAAASARPGDFSTGNDSPVKVASLTKKSSASSTRPSAGTRLPAVSSTMSPGTISRASSSSIAPSRSSRARRLTRASSFSTAREAVYSCVKVSAALATMIVITISESSQSRLIAEITAANTRIRSSGLLNCAASVASAPARLDRPISLGPVACRRRSASAAASPSRRLASAASTVSASCAHGVIGSAVGASRAMPPA